MNIRPHTMALFGCSFSRQIGVHGCSGDGHVRAVACRAMDDLLRARDCSDCGRGTVLSAVVFARDPRHLLDLLRKNSMSGPNATRSGVREQM